MDQPELTILCLIHEALIEFFKTWKPDWLDRLDADNDEDGGYIHFDLTNGRSFEVTTNDIREHGIAR